MADESPRNTEGDHDGDHDGDHEDDPNGGPNGGHEGAPDGEPYELAGDEALASELTSSQGGEEGAGGVKSQAAEGVGGDEDEDEDEDEKEKASELDAKLAAERATEAAQKRHDDAITDGQAVAVLCYVLGAFYFPFWMVPIITRDNFFSLYHAKQAMLLWIGLFVVSVTTWLTCMPHLIWGVVWVMAVLLNVIGLVNANKRLIEPLPLVGGLAESWFSGIRGT